MIPCSRCNGFSFVGDENGQLKVRCPSCWGWGILFRGSMVVAILEGRKVETRRTDRSWLRRCRGDRLWVKETWAPAGAIGDALEYRADNPDPTAGTWRSPLHMARVDSRILLELTADPYLERLIDITDEAAVREGFADREAFLEAFDEMHDFPDQGLDLVVLPFKVIHPETPVGAGARSRPGLKSTALGATDLHGGRDGR